VRLLRMTLQPRMLGFLARAILGLTRRKAVREG